MTSLKYLTERNIKLFFKDKGMFFSSLITPIILLVLYVSFLAKVYKESFESSLNGAMEVPDKLINSVVGGELFSSLIAVSCITVAFCSNLIMVQDKSNGSIKDLTVTPVKKPVLSLSYYLGTMANTLIVCYTACIVCFIYIGATGWYYSFADVLLILTDVFILVLFGTSISSIVSFFLTTQGQMSAVGTIVSAGYGFVCGAYMPISSFGSGLQKAISFLPGTYGTSLLRNHCLRASYREMKTIGFPEEVIESIKDSIDCNLYFFDHKVSIGMLYVILLVSTAVLLSVYILLNIMKKRKKTNKKRIL